MAKTKQVKHEASNPASADAPSADKLEAPKKPAIGVRGPKGVALDAQVTLLVATNPKRPGSKAHAVFSKYVDGMTVQMFLDAAGDEATPNLVYDAAHEFIKIDGYDPKVVVRKVREPKAPKPPKAKKAKAAKAEAEPVAVDDEALEEVFD